MKWPRRDVCLKWLFGAVMFGLGACGPSVQTYPAAPGPSTGPRGPVVPARIRSELPKICRSADMAWFELVIGANGQLAELRLVDATTEQFGAAGSDLLQRLGSWGPALDERGVPKLARIPYRLECAQCETPFCGSVQMP